MTPRRTLSLLRMTIALLLGLLLASCATAGEPGAEPGPAETVPPSAAPAQSPTAKPAAALPDLGPAPDIRNEVWLNTPQPQNLRTLRGKVVLVEFWTFG